MVKALALLLAALLAHAVAPPEWHRVLAAASPTAPPPLRFAPADPLQTLQVLGHSLAQVGLPNLGLRVQESADTGLVLTLQTRGDADALRQFLQNLPGDLPEARVQSLLLRRETARGPRLALDLALAWPAQGIPP